MTIVYLYGTYFLKTTDDDKEQHIPIKNIVSVEFNNTTSMINLYLIDSRVISIKSNTAFYERILSKM